MLRQIDTTDSPPLLYNTSNGITYSLIKQTGRLAYEKGNSGQKQMISLPLDIADINLLPENYLHSLVLVQGEVIFNTEATMATNQGTAKAIVRSVKGLCDRACWQFHIPGSLHGMQLGVCHISTTGSMQYLPFTFNSSTSRTITFLAENQSLKAWVNNFPQTKKHTKPIQWPISECYPYALLASQGTTVLLHTFATEPNTTITRYNPFNTHELPDVPPVLKVCESVLPAEAKIVGVRAVGGSGVMGESRVVVLAEGGWVRVWRRGEGKEEGVRVFGGFVKNFFVGDLEIGVIKKFGDVLGCADTNWSEVYQIENVFDWLKYALIYTDKHLTSHPLYFQLVHLLTKKLVEVRPHTKTPVPIQMCLCSLQQRKHNQRLKYISCDTKPLGCIQTHLDENWKKIQGNVVALSEHYLVTSLNLDLDLQKKPHVQLLVYLVQDGFREVFRGVFGDGEFLKTAKLNAYGDVDTNLWKETTQISQIYKILSNCFSTPAQTDAPIFPPNPKDLSQLTTIFKCPPESATMALEQTGNLEDALAWLADPNHKILRRRPPQHPEGPSGNVSGKGKEQNQVRCDVLEMGDSFVGRLLVMLEGAVYVLGFEPGVLAKRYLQKTQKGFMNLSNFQYGFHLSQLDPSFMLRPLNHDKLAVLDKFSLQSISEYKKSSVLHLFSQDCSPCLLIRNQDQSLSKIPLDFLEQNMYRQQCCLKPTQTPSTPSIPPTAYTLTNQSQLYLSNSPSNPSYKPGTVIYLPNKILTTENPPPEVEEQVTTITTLIQVKSAPPLCVQEVEENVGGGFLPLLVENGPPGCNMNYPICSILYPKSPLPFLANYPYSLKLRHLHKKSMRIQQIIIRRISGDKNNVNQLKQGIIYFTDDAGLKSQNILFRFQEKQNELVLKVGLPGFWQFLVIDPKYSQGAKMPYEIGFVGAKGVTVDPRVCGKAMAMFMEDNITITNTTGKCHFDLKQVTPLSNSTYKLTLQTQSCQPHTICLQSPLLHLQMSTTSTHNTGSSTTHKKEQEIIKSGQLVTMKPGELLACLQRIVSKQEGKDGRNQLLVQVLRDIGRNDGVRVGGFEDGEIRKFVDLWISQAGLTDKEFERLYNKVKKQSTHGSEYLHKLLSQIGLGLTPINPSHLHLLLTKQLANTPNLPQRILDNLLSQLPSHKNPLYKQLHKDQKTPYLLLQSTYFSKHYFTQIQGTAQLPLQLQKCQPIYQSPLLQNYSFVVLKDTKYRRIAINFTSRVSVKNIVVRFDRSQFINRANIVVYAGGEGKGKSVVGGQVVKEHQWMQVVKNPYRGDMGEMFGGNVDWLNGLGIGLDCDVETTYLEIQIMFNMYGMLPKQLNSPNIIQILPQLYGHILQGASSSSTTQAASYFKISPEQKIFLTKISQQLQLSSLNKTPTYFNKYLINKQNCVEYELYEHEGHADSQEGRIGEGEGEGVLKGKGKGKNLGQLVEQVGRTIGDGKIGGDGWNRVVEDYVQVLKQFGDGVKLSNKISLDYIYTVTMWILDLDSKNQIQVPKKSLQQLLPHILQGQTGPITVSTLKSITKYPDLLLKALQHIKIVSQCDPHSHQISTSFIKGSNQIFIDWDTVNKAVEANDLQLAQSFLNIIIDTQKPTHQTIRQCLRLATLVASVEKVSKYLLAYQSEGKKIFGGQDQLNKEIIAFMFDSKVSESVRSAHFLRHLSAPQLQTLILSLLSSNRCSAQLTPLLHTLFTEYSSLPPIQLAILSTILSVQLPTHKKWRYLQKILKCTSCPESAQLIFQHYLKIDNSSSDILELVGFHSGVLVQAARLVTCHRDVVRFLGQLFQVDVGAFGQLVGILAEETQKITLHHDIYSLIVKILMEHCNLGGIQGTKLCPQSQSSWVTTASRLLKLSTPTPPPSCLTPPQCQHLLTWYLLNNDYQQHISNPLNRSQSVNNIKCIGQFVSHVIRSVGAANNIHQVFRVYHTVRGQLSHDSQRLVRVKRVVFDRMQHGVFRLISSSLQAKNLSDMLIGTPETKGLAQSIIQELSTSPTTPTTPLPPQQDLTDQLQPLTPQQNILTPLQCKDLQTYKSGSKSIITKMTVSSKKLYLKSTTNTPFYLCKFVIGFNVQDNNQKNCILPDSVALYGREEIEGGEDGFRKIGDLGVIDDQLYLQFGVRLFAMNCDSLPRKYRNSTALSTLCIYPRSHLQSSTSDYLQSCQKSSKNAIYNISFISVSGYKHEPTSELSFTNIYLKILAFLANPLYRDALVDFVAHVDGKGLMKGLVEVLSRKVKVATEEEASGMENLLIALGKEGVPVLKFLLEGGVVNEQLVDRVVKSNITTEKIQLVIQKTMENPLIPQSISRLTQNIRLCSQNPENPKSTLTLTLILQICKSYKNSITQQIQSSSLSSTSNSTSQSSLLKQIISCITTSPSLFEFDPIQLTKQLIAQQNGNIFYPLVAAYVGYYQSVLEWMLEGGVVPRIAEELVQEMKLYKVEKSVKTENNIANLICILQSVSLHQPTRLHFTTPSPSQPQPLPLKLFSLLINQQSLLEQYPLKILQSFINFFQSTCTTTQQSACSTQFAKKLIDVMSNLPEVQPIYHNYFIHHFFFHLINAYRGVLVSFMWSRSQGHGQPVGYQTGPNQVLADLPIRKNQAVVVVDGQYWGVVKAVREFGGDGKKILMVAGKVVARGDNCKWTVQPTSDCGVRQVKQTQKCLKLVLAGQQKQYTPNSCQIFKCYTHNPTLLAEHQKLLTNQTLLRIKHPSIFPTKYTSTLPLAIGMMPYTYLLPSQMTIKEMISQINICGYTLQEDTKAMLEVRLYRRDKGQQGDGGETVVLGAQEKLVDVFGRVSKEKPLIQLEITSNDLFKHTTIQKIANQPILDSNQSSKFVAQETVFKSFQKLKGLQKMIKVVMACVKNWSNQQQSRVWSQYLSELLSFSCFPIFSSIYMNKKENVELLFNLLSGLPDKQDSKKWLDQEKKSVRSLYDIIKNVFEVQGDQALIVRKFAVENNFYQTMLERLHLVTKEPKRVKVEEAVEEEEEITAPVELIKKDSEEEFKKQIKKKKGVGYGNDSSSSQKWDITSHEEARKELSDQIVGLIKILEKFLSHPTFKLPSHFLESTYGSAMLPILEASLRAGSLLQISKNAEIFKEQLRFIRTISKNQILIPALLQIPKIYEPKQLQSIYSLLTTLEGISKIFLNCLTGSVSEKTSEEIAKEIIETFNQVEEAIEHYKSDHVDQETDKKILELPLAKKYPILMKDLRFDYIDMKDKNGKMKHHYNSNYQAKHNPPSTKTIRLAQELADISQALPIEHTNAIYVRCDKDRVDFMQALIMGSNGTPYGHGAYLFDIYFDDSYPNNPPKVNLTTTGSGSIRFNPNLYACGKVCLSLLGTWRGSAMENWDAKVSTLLQVLVSIQSIIMAEDIYFNEPGFQHEQGTVEGEKKNEAYSNIVRYGNVKFAMIENIKNPPKGFETVIRRHFYLKKDEILHECKKWVKYADKREASYSGLVSDHNSNWSTTFKKSKNQYKTMLEKAINQLQTELNKLPEPSAKDLVKQGKAKKEKKEKKEVKIEKDENLQEIDVTYDANGGQKIKEMDINDEKVKDRWSRYIGAMGLEAVSKQSKASVLMFGISGLGIEIAKNIVMSGCKRFTVCDTNQTSWKDLSGQFYLSQQQIGKNRTQSCLYKLQDLNNYVRVDSTQIDITKLEEENKLKDYQVVITTIHEEEEIKILDTYCRKNGIKFIAVRCEGPFGVVFNDFGHKFQVLDKNGEEAVECFVENISNEENGIVTLMKGQKHPYEDGDQIKITKVKGMVQKSDMTKTINQTIHKISVINQSTFKIGNTTDYTEYEGNGLVKNMKVATQINFKSYEECLKLVNIDENLAYYDFAKSCNNRVLHLCFRALSVYKTENKGVYPQAWNWENAENFYQIYQKLSKQANPEQTEIKDDEKSYVFKFSFTCSGSFAPLAAFYGGLVAQEAFKAITSKYKPITQLFFTDFTEVIETLPKEFAEWKEFLANYGYQAGNDRFEGLRSIVGKDLLEKIRDCKVFVIGSGAIGCELLKNYAMVNIATSEKPNQGTIVVTDPDHIETSNLNRQFLFREKHLQKPKSSTAAAVVKQMNKYLKGENKIRAKLLKVCEATKDTFSNEFFESMDIVTNALDNVQARQYVDLRCVESKVALLESGTLSTKGHVQVIIPYKTETYGSKADPAEEGDIPHCTLKMFPEETLHCVEWARDLFGKTFTMKPKALQKIIEGMSTYTPTESQASVLKDCAQMLRQKPTNFDDAIYCATKQFYKFYRNDIKQLLYTYPLDAKTKDGKDFWKLPKRPPTPIEQISQQIKLHGEFITSYAVLLSKIFNVPYPKDFRTQARRLDVVKYASKIKIDPFVPCDKLAKEMATEVEENKDKKKEEMEEEIKQKPENQKNYLELWEEIKSILTEEAENDNHLKVTAEEFEKDDDANGHIDLIYSMANLRASNYKLDPMDWITTKLKAGRITPALSTTTSCIAALQTIQLIKYLKKLPIEQMKNSFLNLAVPIIQAGQPGELQKIKIHADLTTNIWQRWSIDNINLNEATMSDLFKSITEKYKVVVKTLNILGGGPIYSDLVLGLESKKEERESFMNRKVKDVLSQEVVIQELKNYIDLSLVMAVGEEFVKHVPTLRVNFVK